MGRMGGLYKMTALAVIVLLAGADYGDALAIVTGSVFCDQCLDGKRTLFDLPVDGAKVALECAGSATSKQVTTDLIGNFVMKFDGTPDLSGCSARVIESAPKSECNIVGSPAKALSLTFSLFGMELYSVESLLLHPDKPMSMCPNSDKNRNRNAAPPPAIIPLPPIPFFQASACSYDYWMKKEYSCHWKIVRPDTKVSVVFGEEAGKRYGQNITLFEGLQGRGDVYRTLLREAIASLLNSYNTLTFPYNSVRVVMHMHWILHSASPKDALKQAFSFKKANLGITGRPNGSIQCRLTPCK